MLEQKIKQYAREIGIDLIGFTTAEPFEALEERLIERKDKGHLSGFEEPDIKKRCNPKLVMETAESIIAIGVAYQVSKDHVKDFREKGLKGRMARTAWGRDYHVVLREKMQILVGFIQTLVPNLEYMINVDTGPLVDREVARRAGLGDYGKNNVLIHPVFGSYIYLGNILVNIELKPDQPIAIDCGDCSRCISACPPKALLGPKEMNAKRCISFNTQRKDRIPLEMRTKMHKNIYGCDICQEVCPFNQNTKIMNHEEFMPTKISHKPDLEWLLNISNKDFKETFSTTASGWRGKKILQRNALIAIGNMKLVQGIPLLEKSLKDDRKEIRQYAAWALGNIKTDECRSILEAALKKEEDREVREEITLALKEYT